MVLWQWQEQLLSDLNSNTVPPPTYHLNKTNDLLCRCQVAWVSAGSDWIKDFKRKLMLFNWHCLMFVHFLIQTKKFDNDKDYENYTTTFAVFLPAKVKKAELTLRKKKNIAWSILDLLSSLFVNLEHPWKGFYRYQGNSSDKTVHVLYSTNQCNVNS